MPPKIKVTREDIINAAIYIVRTNGADCINARNIANVLNCSTQPIFSNFASIKQLKNAVVENAILIYKEYEKKEIESNQYPIYKASGMAYIRFAKEESELFKLLFMCDRTNEDVSQGTELFEKMEIIVQNNTGLNEEKSKLFHLEMWAYVHGIATMFATKFLNLKEELVSDMLTDAYLGLRKQYGME